MIHDAVGSSTRPDDPGEPTTGVPRVSVTEEEAEMLATLAVGKRVLEIGTGLGVSAMAMENTARSLVTVDPDPWVHENVWPTLCPQTVKFASSKEVPKLWMTLAGEMVAGYDLIFIDGDHQPASLRADLAFAYDHLAPGGLVVCHDARAAHVWAVLCEFLDRGTWEYRHTAHGLAIQKVLR